MHAACTGLPRSMKESTTGCARMKATKAFRWAPTFFFLLLFFFFLRLHIKTSAFIMVTVTTKFMQKGQVGSHLLVLAHSRTAQ